VLFFTFFFVLAGSNRKGYAAPKTSLTNEFPYFFYYFECGAMVFLTVLSRFGFVNRDSRELRTCSSICQPLESRFSTLEVWLFSFFAAIRHVFNQKERGVSFNKNNRMIEFKRVRAAIQRRHIACD
jgi:hypothetical protein